MTRYIQSRPITPSPLNMWLLYYVVVRTRSTPWNQPEVLVLPKTTETLGDGLG